MKEMKPVITRDTAVLPVKPTPSTSKGVVAIRLRSAKPDLFIEELDAKGHAVRGFSLHPHFEKVKGARKVKAVTVQKIGSTPKEGAPLSDQDRSALKEIIVELTKLGRDEGAEGSSGNVAYDLKGWLGAIDAGIACGLAGVEGGLNPIADVGCAVATGQWLADDDDDDDDDDDGEEP
jgi:hypothetical protein